MKIRRDIQIWGSVKRHAAATGRWIRAHKRVSSIGAVVLLLGIAVGVFFLVSPQEKSPNQELTGVAGEYQRRLPELKKAVDEKPDDVAAHKNYAVALYATKDLDGARKQYEEAAKLNDKDATVYNNLGNVHRDLGNIEESITAYTKSIELNPKSLNVYANLANVQLYRQNNAEAAIATYEKGLKELPDNTQLQLLLAAAYKQADQTDNARETYQTILDREPDNKAAAAGLERL
ncbi:MAG: tetratricopeptide repeat protein [Candidatus Microsaccharimonas sp.]